MSHPGRSSLFVTGFKLSALKDFNWPKKTERFLDISLWSYAKTKKRKFVETSAIGIKHNCGKVGGRGHAMVMKNLDNDLTWLKENVDKEAFEFYSSEVWKNG